MTGEGEESQSGWPWEEGPLAASEQFLLEAGRKLPIIRLRKPQS